MLRFGWLSPGQYPRSCPALLFFRHCFMFSFVILNWDFFLLKFFKWHAIGFEDTPPAFLNFDSNLFFVFFFQLSIVYLIFSLTLCCPFLFYLRFFGLRCRSLRNRKNARGSQTGTSQTKISSKKLIINAKLHVEFFSSSVFLISLTFFFF